MIFKAYGGLPITYAPDVGEVVMARRTPADNWVRAVVLNARRNREGNVKIKVQWMESDPGAGMRVGSEPRKPIVAGTPGFLVIDPGEPPLIKHIDKGSPMAG